MKILYIFNKKLFFKLKINGLSKLINLKRIKNHILKFFFDNIFK